MSHFPHIEYPIRVPYLLRVYFTEGAFDIGNPLFRDLACSRESGSRRKVLTYVDEAVSLAMPDLGNSLAKYFDQFFRLGFTVGLELSCPGIVSRFGKVSVNGSSCESLPWLRTVSDQV